MEDRPETKSDLILGTHIANTQFCMPVARKKTTKSRLPAAVIHIIAEKKVGLVFVGPAQVPRTIR